MDEYQELEIQEVESGLQIHGPFQKYKLTIDGYRVPNVDGHFVGDTFHLVLDERFGLEIPREYATQVTWMIANALAIGAGYSCHGENSNISNPHKVKLSGIKIVDSFPSGEIH